MLPSGYREVEWIGFTGSQYIDTGKVGTIIGGVRFKIVEIESLNYGSLFGIANVNNTFEIKQNSGSFGNWIVRYYGSQIGAFQKDLNGSVVTFNNGEITVNDDTVLTYTNKECAYNNSSLSFLIGHGNDNFSKMKSGEWIWYGTDNETIIASFVPCIRISDNKPGMYDTVNYSFHVNQGTGADFLVGDALLFVRNTTYIDGSKKVYGTFPHTLTASDILQYSVQGHEIRTEWYYDADMTQKANVGDVITEPVELYEKVLNVNKAEYMGEVQIDLTGDTITEEDVPRGVIFHKANGFIVEGSRIVNPVAEENDVIFLDYDGTIRYSYTLEEIQELTELPPAPDHSDEGLVFQEWNWTLQEIKDWGYECEVGANYTTVDGATRFFADIPYDNFEFFCTAYLNSTTVIDFGDGTIVRYPGSGYNDIKHTYSHAGGYVIVATFSVDFSYSSFNNSTNYCIKKIYTGNGFRQLPNNLYNLEILVVSNSGTTLFTNNQGYYAESLKALVVPRGTTQFRANGLYYSYVLKYVSIPCTLTTIATNCITECYTLKRITTPNLTTISGSGANASLRKMHCLEKYIFPETLTSVPATTFEYTYLGECRFLAAIPPTFGNTAILQRIRTNCCILFPYASTDYLTATNYPNPATYAYIGFKKSTNGETLPTTVGSYSLTWYVSKGDAQAQTNPITTGNGKEVYARYTA